MPIEYVKPVRLSFQNKSQSIRCIPLAEGGKNITIKPGDERTFEVHPHHARMLLREASKANAKIKIDMDDADKLSVMAPSEPRKPKTSAHYITDPKTVGLDMKPLPRATKPARKTPKRKPPASERLRSIKEDQPDE